MWAMSATAPSGRAPVGASASCASPMPLSPWTSVARTIDPSNAPAAPSATGTSSRPYVWSSRSAFSVHRVTSAFPPTVVTASRSISGDAAASPIASASSRPGSESMISGMGRSGVPHGALRSAEPALWYVGIACTGPHSSTLWPALTSALVVWLAGGRGAADAPDDTGDNDDRDDVRHAVEQLGRDVDAQDRQQRLGGVREPEHQRSSERIDRVPRAEDHRGERDEAAARAHVHLERAGRREAQGRAGDAREQPGHQQGAIPDPDDVDADGAGGRRLLAGCPEAEAPARPEQHVREGDHHEQREVHVRRLVEQDRSDHRDVAEERELDGLDRRRRVELGVLGEDAQEQEVRHAEGTDADDHAGDDLVDLPADPEPREQQADEPGSERGGDDSDERRDAEHERVRVRAELEPDDARDHRRDARGEEELALDPDVEHS